MARTVGRTRWARRIARWGAWATVWSLGLLIALAALARFMDGPLGPFPGGPLEWGTLVDSSKVTTAIGHRSTIELQLFDPALSRTTWIVEHDGELYVPCLMAGSWKQWPFQAMEDGRALIRAGDRLYSRDLVRVRDTSLHAAVLERLGEKYGVEVDDPEDVWLFRLERPFEAVAGRL